MRRFTIVRTYDKDDEKIEGFFEALDYLGIAYEKSEIQRHETDD